MEEDRIFQILTLRSTGLYYSQQLDLLLLADQGSAQVLLVTDHVNRLPESHPDIHDVLEVDGQIYAVDTETNSVHHLHTDGSTTQWVYSEVKDSWHVNCLGVWQGRVVFSAFGEFTECRIWKDRARGQGFVQDLLTGEQLITGLSMPHSLVAVGDHLLLANSQDQEIHEYNTQGILLRRKALGGYTRGICVDQGVVYVGLSRGRDPYLGQNKEKAREYAEQTAVIIALDAQTWDELGRVELPSREVYSIVAIPTAEDLNRILAALGEWTLHSHSSLPELVRQNAQLTQQVAQLTQQMAQLEQHNTALAQQTEALQQQLAQLTVHHTQLQSSFSWKVTRPLRRLRNWLRPSGR